MNLRQIGHIAPNAIVAAGLLLVGKAVGPELSALAATALVIPVVVVYVAIFYAVESLLLPHIGVRHASPPSVDSLRTIFNACAKSDNELFTPTTLGAFLESTESRLGRGDEMRVLTHDLGSYDCTPPALNVIAENLSEGVKYEYFLPPEEAKLVHTRITFVSELKKRLRVRIDDDAHVDQIVHNQLHLRVLREPSLYHFALIIRRPPQALQAAWYMTTPNRSSPADSAVLLLHMSEERAHELLGVFDWYRKSSRRIDVNGSS